MKRVVLIAATLFLILGVALGGLTAGRTVASDLGPRPGHVYDGPPTPVGVEGPAGAHAAQEQVFRGHKTPSGEPKQRYDDRSQFARASARPGEYRLAPQTTLYRAVSTAEADDIARFEGFRAGPNSYEGKLFATSAEDAARYGRINDALTPGGSPFHIVETRVPTSLANSFERMTLDSMQAVHVAEGQLGALNAAGRWRTWDWVPWVGKPGSGL